MPKLIHKCMFCQSVEKERVSSSRIRVRGFIYCRSQYYPNNYRLAVAVSEKNILIGGLHKHSMPNNLKYRNPRKRGVFFSRQIRIAWNRRARTDTSRYCKIKINNKYMRLPPPPPASHTCSGYVATNMSTHFQTK